MLNKKQINEIREHLEKAQNPLFFFDNDQDGLCSFLLLQRYIGRGKGVPIKSFPDMAKEYFRKIEELDADYVFILDKPVVSPEFFEEVHKINLPIVWIDHHLTVKENIPNFVNYYNPLFNKKKTEEPVTALCYQVTKRKEDLWIAVIGCISDRYVPSFYNDFEKIYPDLSIKYDDAFDIFYKSQIGKISRILSFGLKDRTTNVINMLRLMMKVKNPSEILEENPKTHSLLTRFNEINSKYQRLLVKAKTLGQKSDKLIFFQYGGDLSISAELSNEINYLFPKKMVVVAYTKGAKINLSVRGHKIRAPFLKSIENLDGAMGGGHEDAVGGQIRVEDVERFKENFEKNIG